jgi:hypothetical protein
VCPEEPIHEIDSGPILMGRIWKAFTRQLFKWGLGRNFEGGRKCLGANVTGLDFLLVPVAPLERENPGGHPRTFLLPGREFLP